MAKRIVKAVPEAPAREEAMMIGLCPRCRKTIALFSYGDREDFHRACTLDGVPHSVEHCEDYDIG